MTNMDVSMLYEGGNMHYRCLEKCTIMEYM